MSQITINNNELYLTDNATNESTVFKFKDLIIIGDDQDDVFYYLEENEKIKDNELNLIEQLIPFTEYVFHQLGFEKTECLIVDYMLDHGGDTVLIESYIEILELVENRSDDTSIEHCNLCREFRLIDDDDIDQIYQDYIEEMVKDCYLGGVELPSFLAIDWKQTASNCKDDGYGNSFSGYDGSEDQIGDLYIFCTN